MSSVEGSGRDESASRAREEYIKKENELVKKHKKELRKVTEANMRELDHLRRAQSAQIENMRDKSRESMTKRDQIHQNEVAKMRDMHHKHLQKIMKDNETRLQVLKDSTKSEIHQANLGKEDRVTELNTKYGESVERLKRDYSANMDMAREEQAKALNDTREKLNERHREERNATKKYNDEIKADLQNKLRISRKSYQERLRDKEIQHFNDKQRMSQNFMATIGREREINRDNMDAQREGFQDSLERNRDQFRKKFEDDAEARTLGFQNLKRDVNGRINARVGRLEQQVGDLKHKNARNEIEQKRKADRYVNNMRDSYQDKFESLEKMRQEAIQANNDQNHRNIKEIRKETSDLMEQNSRYYRSRMETENFKNREALRAEKNSNELRHQVQKDMANERVLNVRAESDRNLARMRENYTTNLEANKKSAHEEKREQMLVNNKERSEAMQRMKERFQKQEAEHARKMNDVRTKYETRITEMQDRFTREKRLRDNREKTTLANVNRLHQNEIETQKMQFKDKMQKSKNMHERELATVEKRHKEEMDSLLRTVRQQNLNKA